MRLLLSLIIAPLFFGSSTFAQERFLPVRTETFNAGNFTPPPLPNNSVELEISRTKSGKFLSLEKSPNDLFKFLIRTTNEAQAHSSPRVISIGKTAHNILLRKVLLQKLGYELPATEYLPQIEIQFEDRTAKKNFISKLELRTGADTDRWVKEENKESIILQDAVISEPSKELDLSSGELSREQILGRSSLNALIVPYTLTNIPESINLLSWISGTIYNEGVKVDYPNSDEYTPTADDIQNILKRIASLSRTDWIEIAKAAHLPAEVETLLVEKMISRRNSFLELFSIPEPAMDFDPKITVRPHLLNGQVTKKEWPGYASHFSFGSPDSPLNPGEALGFMQTGIFSLILKNAVAKLNEIPIFRGDSAAFNDTLAKLGSSGKSRHIPIGVFGFPFASGELIFSRDIVTGSFMGTDNLLQMADQFGVRLSIGAQLTMDDLPTPVGAGIKGTVSISRTYSHLRPIKSVRKANRFGYQNVAIPFFIRSSVNKLNPIFNDGFEDLPPEQKRKVYQEALEDFKHKIAPGESLIVTDSLVGDGKVTGSVNLYQLIDLSAAANTSELVINRLHIYRKDENTFQIYKDFGEATQPSFGMEIGVRKPIPHSFLPVTFDKEEINSATLPIIRAKWGQNQGHSTIQFYTIHFASGNESTDNLDESAAQLKILQQTMLHSSTETLKKHVKPYVIENRFREKNLQERVLFFSERRLKTVSDIRVTSPDGEKKTFVRDFFGKSDAFDYKNTIANILDFGFELATRSKVDFAADNSINPGYTTNGHAKNKLLSFEAEEMPDGSLRDSFVKISRIYNGWKLSKSKIQKILDRFSRDYGGKLFAPTALNETEKMFLYRISLDISLYEPAIQHLLSLTEADVRTLFAKYGIDLDHRLADDRIVNHLQYFKKTHSSKALMKAISIADHLLPAEGFIELLGGKENLFITAKVDGFRKGDENDSPILSNTIGITGASQTNGPLSAIRAKLGMTEGEFLSLWILGRIL